MLTNVKKGLATGLIIVIIAISNQVIAETNSTEGLIVEEKEMVSLRTISITKEPTAITDNTVIATNPKRMAIEKGKEENIEASKIVIKRKTLKSVKKYLSLEEVRKKLKRDMDISKPSGLSKEEFVKLIRNMDYDYTGVFRRNAEFIWNLAHKYQLNEIFFMGIIANESGWGGSEEAVATNNYTSQMKIVKRQKKVGKKTIVYKKKILRFYTSEKKCFEETAINLRDNYLTKNGDYYNGVTICSVNKEYCEAGKHKDGTPYKYQWADEVYGCMQMILGLEK